MAINITLRQLQAFLAVAENGSYIKASEVIRLSQPAVTANVQELEHRLGVRLLNRTTRNVELTNEGGEFFAATRRLLDELNTTISDVRALGEQRRGHLTIACLPSVAVQLVGPMMREFSARHPGIFMKMFDGDMRNVAHRVYIQEADFGVSGHLEQDPELEFTPLLRDRFALVCPKDHPLARRPVVRLEEVSAYPFIAMGPTTGTRQVLDNATIKSGIRLNFISEIEQLSTVTGMIKAGFGVSILPEACVSIDGGSDLVSRKLVDPTVERDIGLITRKGRSLSPAALRFRDALIEGLDSRWKTFASRYYMPPTP